VGPPRHSRASDDHRKQDQGAAIGFGPKAPFTAMLK
jgi:hypothetical protein